MRLLVRGDFTFGSSVDAQAHAIIDLVLALKNLKDDEVHNFDVFDPVRESIGGFLIVGSRGQSVVEGVDRDLTFLFSIYLSNRNTCIPHREHMSADMCTGRPIEVDLPISRLELADGRQQKQWGAEYVHVRDSVYMCHRMKRAYSTYENAPWRGKRFSRLVSSIRGSYAG